MENLVHHELSGYRAYRDADWDLSYWRLAGGTEVDFIVGNLELAIEVKSAERIGDHHLSGLRSLQADHPGLGRRIVVCWEPRRRVTADGIEILPLRGFLERPWSDELGRPTRCE